MTFSCPSVIYGGPPYFAAGFMDALSPAWPVFLMHLLFPLRLFHDAAPLMRFFFPSQPQTPLPVHCSFIFRHKTVLPLSFISLGSVFRELTCFFPPVDYLLRSLLSPLMRGEFFGATGFLLSEPPPIHPFTREIPARYRSPFFWPF